MPVDLEITERKGTSQEEKEKKKNHCAEACLPQAEVLPPDDTGRLCCAAFVQC